MGCRAALDGCGNVASTGIRSPNPPVRSESPYRLSYPRTTCETTNKLPVLLPLFTFFCNKHELWNEQGFSDLKHLSILQKNHSILPPPWSLRGVRWFVMDVSGLSIGAIFKGQASWIDLPLKTGQIGSPET